MTRLPLVARLYTQNSASYLVFAGVLGAGEILIIMIGATTTPVAAAARAAASVVVL